MPDNHNHRTMLIKETQQAKPELVWDKPLYLSTNAIQLLLVLVTQYDSEPWDEGLRQDLIRRLEAFEFHG